MEVIDSENEGGAKSFIDQLTGLHHTMRGDMQFWLVKMASRSTGQYLIKKLHSILWTIEKTIKWTQSKPNDLKKKGSEQIRPLPWIFFLPLLMLTRAACYGTYEITRRIKSIGPVTPLDIVAELQLVRRNMRSIRLQGLRDIALRRQTSCNSMLLVRLVKCIAAPFYGKTRNEALINEDYDRSLHEDIEDLESALNRTYPENDENDPTFDADDFESSERSSCSYESLSDSTAEKDESGVQKSRKRRRQRKAVNTSYTDIDGKPMTSSSANTTTDFANNEEDKPQRDNAPTAEDHLEQQIRLAESQHLAGIADK